VYDVLILAGELNANEKARRVVEQVRLP